MQAQAAQDSKTVGTFAALVSALGQQRFGFLQGRVFKRWPEIATLGNLTKPRLERAWRSHQNAPESGDLRDLRTRWGNCSSIKARPIGSWGVSSSWSN